MINVLILGCGQIGRAIANILKYSVKYYPVLADSQIIFPSDWPKNQTCQLDIQNIDQAVAICQKKISKPLLTAFPFSVTSMPHTWLYNFNATTLIYQKT